MARKELPISLVTLERPGEENPSGIVWNASQQQVKSVVKEEPQRKTSKIIFEPFGGITSVPPVSLVEQEALPQQEGGPPALLARHCVIQASGVKCQQPAACSWSSYPVSQASGASTPGSSRLQWP